MTERPPESDAEHPSDTEHPEPNATTAHLDDEQLADAGAPLPGEGHGDPMTRAEETPLEAGNDPETGLPTERDALR